jgi:hypothetical protein
MGGPGGPPIAFAAPPLVRAEEIVAAKPETIQARNAGDSNKAQGEASVFCERNPGLTKSESQAHGVGARRRNGSFQGAVSITRSAGSVPLHNHTQGSAARLAAIRRSASPWALFEPPAFAGLANRNRPASSRTRLPAARAPNAIDVVARRLP